MAIDQAVRNPVGTNQHVSNRHTLRAAGTTRDRALRRLPDHRPNLHARVLAKKLSAHAAMIEAGFLARTFTVHDVLVSPRLFELCKERDIAIRPVTDEVAGSRRARRHLVIEDGLAGKVCSPIGGHDAVSI